MRDVTISDLLSEKGPTIDCLVIDDAVRTEKATELKSLFQKFHSTILVWYSKKNDSDNQKNLSHDVFKSLENVFRQNDYMGQRDIEDVLFPSKRRGSFSTESTIASRPKKYNMLLWTNVLDEVYPHVWDELNQVYNVNFLKLTT